MVVEAACLEQDGGETPLRLASEGGDPNEVGSGHSTTIFPDGHAFGLRTLEISVPRVSIDGLVARVGKGPRAIKIDVEGAELEVLAGARETLVAHRPLVRVGFHPFAFEDPMRASRKMREMLHQCGYRMEGNLSDQLALAEYDCMPEGTS